MIFGGRIVFVKFSWFIKALMSRFLAVSAPAGPVKIFDVRLSLCKYLGPGLLPAEAVKNRRQPRWLDSLVLSSTPQGRAPAANNITHPGSPPAANNITTHPPTHLDFSPFPATKRLAHCFFSKVIENLEQ